MYRYIVIFTVSNQEYTIDLTMRNTEANIEITRKNGVLHSVSVIMPTWNKFDLDNNIFFVDIPMLGIKTFAKDENDSVKAIHEAVKCFSIAAEKFGKGLDQELVDYGWSKVLENAHSSLNFNIDSNDEVIEQIMKTGEPFVEKDLMIA